MSIARFGVNKPVPVNLIMVGLLVAGAVSGLSLRREFFPETQPDQALVELSYPGATPEEIEQTLAIKVEDKLAELDEVKELRTTLSEGGGGITVEFREGLDVDKALDEVERAIDTLTDLPQESERIQVKLFEPKLPIIRVVVFGDLDERVMKRAIRGVRDDLRSLPGMGEVVVEGVRDYEVRVDVRADALIEHGMSLPQVSDAIGDWMAEVPGGTVRNQGGDIKVRTMGVSERARAIRDIILRADTRGNAVRLGDIAQVTDSFVDAQVITRYNGQKAVGLVIFKVGDQDIVNIAQMVRAYVQGRLGRPFEPRLWERLTGADRRRAWELGQGSSQPLPAGVGLDLNTDLARFVEGRLHLLQRNARYGAVLVFATLLFFLNWRVAVWVGMGLLTALMGTLVLMSAAGITLNLLTMFGMIVVLGLLVDDAIVVSENIQAHHDRGDPAITSAVTGTEEVLWPVVATVLTTVVAFIPLSFLGGRIGDLMGALPVVVACALLMSLVEALLILPSHMAHSLARRDRLRAGRLTGMVRRVERWRDGILYGQVVPRYGRVLSGLVRCRYLTVTIAVAIWIVSLGLVRGGHVPYAFLPSSDAETVIVDIRMPIGTPVDQTNSIVARIEQAASGQVETKSIASLVGQRTNIDSGVADAFSTHIAQMFIELQSVEQRQRHSLEVIDAIREALQGQLDDVERIAFTQLTGGPAGADIAVRVRGQDSVRVNGAVGSLKRRLAAFAGVHEIADDDDLGQLELQIRLRPGAAALGFSTAEVARQVRGFLYGLEAHVFAADEEDTDVRVRLDEKTRHSLTAIENVWLIGPEGRAVPLSEVADVVESSTYATIKRVDRQRTVTVTAATAPGTSPESISSQLPINQLRQAYPDLSIDFSGRQQQQAEAFASLPLGVLAAVGMIYVILAWLFSSYVQPALVVLVIPFSFVGVVLGHLLLGYDLTFLSLIGLVALSGIVVNDALILVEFYNAERAKGHNAFDSVVAAGCARLRAIVLTTLTTVLGLTPLILEQSFQAKFLIPMAIAIAGGLMSATVLVLIVLPCFLVIFDDLQALAHYLWHGVRRSGVAVPADAAVRV